MGCRSVIVAARPEGSGKPARIGADNGSSAR